MSAAHTMRRFARRDPSALVNRSLAELLHPSLTLPKHPQSATDPHEFIQFAEALPLHGVAPQRAEQLASQQPVGCEDTERSQSEQEPSSGRQPSRSPIVGAQTHTANTWSNPTGLHGADPEPQPSSPSHHRTTVADERSDTVTAFGTESRSGLQPVLASPAALQTLLKDPTQLQRLLERNPALLSVLKSKLAPGGG